MTSERIKCSWCGREHRRPSNWEQETLSGSWRPLCVACARKRLGNPYNALLPMRRAARLSGGDGHDG